MKWQLLVLFGVIGLTGACKKEDLPLSATTISLQVIYQQSRLPVDSAMIGISGTKGTYLSGRDIKIFQQGYTDKQGRFQASMMIPRDYYTTFTAGKLIKIGNHYQSYDLSIIMPVNNPVLKLEQENIIVAELDTLK
jgi:hypothetical protein